MELVEKLAAKVEKEKMRAIGAHNMLQTMEKKKERNLQQLRVSIKTAKRICLLVFKIFLLLGVGCWKNRWTWTIESSI